MKKPPFLVSRKEVLSFLTLLDKVLLFTRRVTFRAFIVQGGLAAPVIVLSIT